MDQNHRPQRRVVTGSVVDSHSCDGMLYFVLRLLLNDSEMSLSWMHGFLFRCLNKGAHVRANTCKV